MCHTTNLEMENVWKARRSQTEETGTEDFKRVDEGRDVFTMKEAQMSIKKKTCLIEANFTVIKLKPQQQHSTVK